MEEREELGESTASGKLNNILESAEDKDKTGKEAKGIKVVEEMQFQGGQARGCQDGVI